jgi:hypothetical protein
VLKATDLGNIAGAIPFPHLQLQSHAVRSRPQILHELSAITELAACRSDWIRSFRLTTLSLPLVDGMRGYGARENVRSLSFSQRY